MDVPYLMHVPDGDELWLVDGEQRMLITSSIYDLLTSKGADLPPAYGIEELREQNAKLRELVRSVMVLQHDSSSKWLDEAMEEVFGMSFTAQALELGIEVK